MRHFEKIVKIVILIIVLLGVTVALASCGVDSDEKVKTSSSKRSEFKVECTADGMKKFMKVVCKNVDGDTEIVESHVGEDTWGYNYWVDVSVKLKDKVSENATIVFYNRDDSEIAGKARITIFDPKSENAYNCKKELILALERTLSGKTVADKYITTYYEAERLAYEKEGIVAEYWLTDELFVSISASNSGRMSWTVEYSIMTSDEYIYYINNKKSK